MEFISKYVSHTPDSHGYVKYSVAENEVWTFLFERQIKIIKNFACKEFIRGIKLLRLSKHNLPQLPDVNQLLYPLTGWEVVPVAALISAREFFNLLAKRHFPAAVFIRNKEEVEYVQEPDIFHELFGHCPMLTNLIYADFLYNYAQMVLTYPESEWPLLQRLFWFTVEFGLIKTNKGFKAYGGGILSSILETPYSVTSDIPMRVYFDPVTALRTPYRIDQLQKVYFVIENYNSLYQLVGTQMQNYIQRAKELGEFPPFFSIDKNDGTIHILAC